MNHQISTLLYEHFFVMYTIVSPHANASKVQKTTTFCNTNTIKPEVLSKFFPLVIITTLVFHPFLHSSCADSTWLTSRAHLV